MQEHVDVIEFTMKQVGGRIPVIAGTGANSTQEAINLTQKAKELGADACLLVAPYYNKPTQEGIYQHFKAIANASPVPVILYNVPGRTGSNMLPSTVLRLANEFKNVVAIKEAAGDIVQAMSIIKDKPKDFHVISGDDMIALPMVLAGGSGVISVIGQGFPKQFSDLIQFGLDRKVDEAFQLQYKLADSIDMIFEQGNPGGIKEVLKSLEISDNCMRLPLVNVNSDLANRIDLFVQKNK
jgi:4-hydroxy-tetrahydrodipicolinate synthase